MEMTDVVTQVDAVTIEFEIDKAEKGVISKPRDVSFTRYASPISCCKFINHKVFLSALALLLPLNSSQLN